MLGRECTVPVVRVLWSLGGEASGGPSCFLVAGHSLGAGGECLVVCGGNGGEGVGMVVAAERWDNRRLV